MNFVDKDTAIRNLTAKLAAEGFEGEEVDKNVQRLYGHLKHYAENGTRGMAEMVLVGAFLPKDSVLSKQMEDIAIGYEWCDAYSLEECISKMQDLLFSD